MEKKLSKKALLKSFHNWFYGHLTCFSQEHMQTFGYLCAMLPLVEELYQDEEEKAKAMNTYTAFFNTEPQLGTVVIGMTAGLEEARANGQEDVDDETRRSDGAYRRYWRFPGCGNCNPDSSWYRNGDVRRRFPLGRNFLHNCMEPVCVFWYEVPVF